MVRRTRQTAWKAKQSQTVTPRWTKPHKSHKQKLWLQQSKPSLWKAKVKLQGIL